MIQEDIMKEDFEGALNTIESNMNELIYDYKELERNKEDEEEEDFKAKIKELKANIRFLTFYKLSMKVCIQVSRYKGSTDQNDQEMCASLANILVLPPVHEEVKKLFNRMAINENMRCRNYKVALKLLKSYDKQIKNPTEEDIQEVNNLKEECELHKTEGKERFESVDCPRCDENLPFGHATPSCSRCHSKILFCNETLIPLVPDTALRCYICFATYDKENGGLFIPDNPSLCPNCRFGTLKQVQKSS